MCWTVELHADPTCFIFRPRILTPEEGWKLWERIVFPSREIGLSVYKEMEAMGKEMLTYCGGLPLVVKVLGGLLAEKHTVPEWKRVYDNIRAQIVGKPCLDEDNPNSVYRVLSLSYEDLPMVLKQCFLYLAHFPEDYKICKEKLFIKWAAEGIITSFYDGSSIRDSGEECLEELVKRNVVFVEKNYLKSKFEFCQMHDMMRKVCLSKAKEENYLQIVRGATSTFTINAQSPIRSRRLAVHSGNALCHILGHKNSRKVRSLLVFGVEEVFWTHLSSGFQSLPVLRVLNLYKVKFEGGKLPSSLNLAVVLGEPVHVPNVLKEMLELRYLSLPQLMDDKTELELDCLVNLEALCSFSTQHSTVTNLLRMTKLRTLVVNLRESCSYETLLASLRELRNLEKFYLSADFVGEFVLDMIHLKDLTLHIYMPKLHDQFRFPPHLAHIRLTWCHMEEDPMPILESCFI
ncbi:putative disease resistance RPP8-like protein 4 [Cardamine amara subsp. amara]|uniref:Disease resistance RPP8-like protein 4 n=1 Tax=Cardamine amara subsp. amara TaxID=228776 RepID=A0ABD1ALA1_CARAN